MKKSNQYEMLFRKNKDTDRIIIDVALNNYLEFFHEWDNAVFKKRDINSELVEFFDICSEEIPLNKKLEIAFSINTVDRIEEKEEQIRISYRNYYRSLKRSENRKIKRFLRMSIILIFISLVLLTSYGLFMDVKLKTIVSRVLLESLLIGGWVFAWEAVHTLFIDIFEPLHRSREMQRFLDADISFIYLSKQ
ncbi:MAG: hypothetical protein GX289_00655 [Tissierellia bacterium]|nr:hypothetical protein [Tissierellia bacterium]